ncbi:MAG: restriction endonuclease, partial [Gemmobacter sp.]
EEEYFATRKPEIAALSGAARKAAIAQLETTDPASFASFIRDKRQFEAVNEFARESGRFDLTARGKVNTYGLFAELFASLARGRAGVIVPTGIATDATTAPFFAHLVEQRRLVRLTDFENRAGLFPAVDSRMKFALLTLGRDAPLAEFAFFLTEPGQLAEAERRFTLTPDQIAAINPNTRTAPVFRSRADADLTAKIYRNAPVLIDEGRGAAGNPWGVEFRQGLFNMTSDSHLFRTAAQLRAGGFARQGADWVKDGARQEAARHVPLYEAKMIHQFDHRWAGYDAAGEGTLDPTPAQKADPAWEPSPRYWVPEAEVAARLSARGWTRGWLMGWRDITNATNERTVIATVFPRVGVGHKLPLCFLEASPLEFCAFSGCLNSLTFDFVARQKVGGTNLAFFYLKQLPILPPAFYTPARLAFLTPRVLELAYTSHSLAPFARDLGHMGPPFPWDEGRRAALRADLDAFYARAYGLTRDELRYILDPAEVKGAGYPSETFRVLKEKELRAFGDYRTARLTVAAWDRFEGDGTFAGLGL